MRTHPRERKGLDVLKTFVSEGSHKRSGSQAGATVMLPVTPPCGGTVPSQSVGRSSRGRGRCAPKTPDAGRLRR